MTDEPRPDRIKVFKREDQLWDYNVVAPNGEVTEGSVQGFTKRSDAVMAARRNHPELVVEERMD